MIKSKDVIRLRRDRERAQRIQAILDAATRVFFSRGYLKSTVDEIAPEAEVSKPTVYLYFKNKDDLFFSLMLPYIEDMGVQFGKVEDRLIAGTYASGASLVSDLVDALWHTYERFPDRFKVFLLFQLSQQTDLVDKLSEDLRAAVDESGKHNMEVLRRILAAGMQRGLLEQRDVFELADVIHSTFIGIVQFQDFKSHKKGVGAMRHLETTLRQAKQILADSVATKAVAGTKEPQPCVLDERK